MNAVTIAILLIAATPLGLLAHTRAGTRVLDLLVGGGGE